MVYHEQILKSDSAWVANFTENRGTYVETYLRHNLWLEILFKIRWKGQLEFYCALIESAKSVNKEIFSRTGQSSSDGNSDRTWQDDSMLVNNVNYIEYPEWMPSFLPIRSIIRLYRLNISPDIIVKAFKASDELVIPFDEDGEAGERILFDGNRPSDVVKSGTQSVSNLTNQQSPSNGEFSFGEVRADDIVVLLRVFSDAISIRLACDEGFDFSVEDIKVLLRPVYTPEGIGHLLHNLYYPQSNRLKQRLARTLHPSPALNRGVVKLSDF